MMTEFCYAECLKLDFVLSSAEPLIQHILIRSVQAYTLDIKPKDDQTL